MKPTLEFLRLAHEIINPDRYIEIGVREGRSLALCSCQAIGIDPAFNITEGVSCPVELYREKSDAFFATREPSEIFEGMPFGLALIDGFHSFRQALKDFINIERCSSSESIVLFDDVMPKTPQEAVLEPYGGPWAGDVWRIIPCLSKYRPDLNLAPFESRPCGILVVRGTDPSNTFLSDNFDSIVQEFTVQAFAYPGFEELKSKYGFLSYESFVQHLKRC